MLFLSSRYKKLATLQGVGLIRPISSKGIKYEIERQVSHSIDSPNELDIEKSSGPSTSFLVIYDTKIHSVITDMAGKHIQLINTLTNLTRSEEHTSELQSRGHLVCRLLLEKKKY